MKLYIIIKSLLPAIVIIGLVTINCEGQSSLNELHQQTIQTYVDGYNQQDFKKMAGTFSGIMKLVFNENTLAQIYGYKFTVMGKANIRQITPISDHSYRLELIYDRDTTEIESFGFHLSKKNKIIGLNSKSEKFHFTKKNTISSQSPEELNRQIDSLVKHKNIAGNFSGCVLVKKDKRIIYENCEGYREFDKKNSLNDSAIFELASCSKAFTAMAIMILCEQNKLNYSDPVENFIPGFPYKNITIENLLTHTSGLPDYMELLNKHWDKSRTANNQDVMNYLVKYKPNSQFKPGKKFEYSNTGYVMLALIIEKASEQTYAKFLSANIFVPLKMKHTRVYNTRRSTNEIIPNYAYGHVYSDSLQKYILPDSLREYGYLSYLDGITGDGTVNSTIQDLSNWIDGLQENTLVKKETFERALSPYKFKKDTMSNYGYGWEIQSNSKYEKLYHHTGSWPGYLSLTLISMDRDLSIVILSNNEYMNIGKLTGRIMGLVNQ